MKIDIASSYNVYRKNSTQDSAVNKKSIVAADIKTDKADFSRGSTQAPDKNMAAVKASILRDISADVGVARIATLKESIKNNSYHVSTEQIADSILGI